MDQSSINSLNSKRNLKLPPIQGAVPAAVYGERNWNSTTNTIPNHRQRARPRNDLVHAGNFQSLNRVDLNSRVEFPRQKAAVFTSPSRQHHVHINLGHEFPKSYTVLPPINHHKKATVPRHRKPPVKQIDHSNVELSIQQNKSPVNEENKPQTKSCAETVDQLSARRRERLQEKTSRENNNKSTEDIKKIDDTSTDKKNSNNNNNKGDDNNRTEEEQEDISTRKKSATLLGYVQCTRYGRRNAVCIENEPTLNNVTDQLKEIFLRRNMEEMYLI